MRRVNVQVRDGIDPAVAIEHVAIVMRGGRVSQYNTHYCWVTTFSNNIVVYVRGPNKRAANSDSFVVYKERKNGDEAGGEEPVS